LFVSAIAMLGLATLAVHEYRSGKALATANTQLVEQAKTLAGERDRATRLLKELEDLRRLTSSNRPTTKGAAPEAASVPDTLLAPDRRRVLWSPGQTLRVRFLDGSDALRGRVQRALSEWTKYANIRLEYVADGDAEVRVTFAQPGSWAFVGKQRLEVPTSEPTVCYGTVKEATPDDQFASAVLHEFGHVLGLVHEFTQRHANIAWNKAVVYRELSQSGWSKETVDQNFFRQDGNWLPDKPFDPKSIMMYSFPRSWTTNGVAYEQPTQLSDGDKAYIAQLYPAAR